MAENNAEKLQRFTKSVEADIVKQSEQMKNAAEEEYAEAIKAAKENADREAYEKINKAENAINAKYRREQALEEQKLRREHLLTRQELKESVMENVRKRLLSFMETSEYPSCLLDMLKGEDLKEAVVMLSDRDMKYAPEIKKQFGVEAEKDSSILLGGLSIAYKNSDVMIDKTFDSMMEEQSSLFSSRFSFEREEAVNG